MMKTHDESDQYISVKQRKEQFQNLSNNGSHHGSMGSLTVVEKPVYSAAPPAKSQSRTSMGSHQSSDSSRPMSSFGMRNSAPAPKPVMKPASNITSFDNRKGTGKSLGGDDDVSASLASSADFDHITPLSSMNELELKNAKIEFLEGKWKKNVSRLQSELETSNPNSARNAATLTAELQNDLNDRDLEIKSQQETITKLQQEIITTKARQSANKSTNLTKEHEDFAEEIERLNDDLETSRQNEQKYKFKIQEYEMKMEEHSKVKAMIDGINQSNLKNLESFEEQIKQRNITIEALRSDIEEKRKRMEKAENELNVTVEQKERYRVEAQQASDKGVLEQQLEESKDKVERLENDVHDKDEQMHELTLQFQSNLGDKMRENGEMKQALDFTTSDLVETKSRLGTAEHDLAEYQKSDPKLRKKCDDQEREIERLRDNVSHLEIRSSTGSVKVEKLQEENERLREDCLSNSAKVQEHLASVRIAEKNSEDYRRNYEREKEKINKTRNEVDELRAERLNLIRERDEKDMKLSLSDEKLANSETKARALDLDLRKALQNEEQTRSSSDLNVINAERKVSAIEIDLDNVKVKNDDLQLEMKKVRAELDASRKQDISQTKKIAQLEAQVSAEHETRGSLSLREQSWMNERMELKEEIQKFRLEATDKKRQLEQNASWHKDQSADTSQKIKLLETDLHAKLEDAERYKQINDKQHRALISQEEKGFAAAEENTLLKRELERLKMESNTVTSSTNDQLINLRNEIETLKAKLKVEIEARKAAQRLAKELQIKLDKLRLKGAKRGKTDGKEIEEIQKRYQEEARKELEEKLSQVSQFLAKQSDAHDRLERLRSENLQNDKHNSYRKITELEAELCAIKNRGHVGTNDIQNDQKYHKLYREECRARERSDNNSRRVEKKLMELQDRLETERRSRISTGSGYFTGSGMLGQSYSGFQNSRNLQNFQNQRLNSTFPIAESNIRRTSPDVTQSSGLYSRMMDVVERAQMEPTQRASPLQRI